MGRPSNREARRAELIGAFSKVLAEHGYAGATIAAVAAEAGVAPGLVHHHFRDKQELLSALLRELIARFRRRNAATPGAGVESYLDAALSLDRGADVVAARCWVGIFAEALREPALFDTVRRMIDAEVELIRARSDGALSSQDASAVLAYVIGALVLGAFAPRRVAGFAAPAGHRLLAALGARPRRAGAQPR